MDSFQYVLNLTPYFRMRIDRQSNERHFHVLLLFYFTIRLILIIGFRC